jgi:hypothetical protein
MALVLGVNSYATLTEADLYFEDRSDVAAWDSATDTLKEQALVTATQYLDQLSFAGYTSEETQYLAWPRVGTVAVPSRGRDITFDKDYVFADLSDSDSDFEYALMAQPFEIRLIKIATFEQTYHIINNEGLLDYSGDAPKSIRVGSINLEGLGTRGTAPKIPQIVNNLLKPLRNTGNSMFGSTWYRAN